MPFTDKSASIQDFLNDLTMQTYGITVSEALAEGICIQCREPALPKCYSDAGRAEHQISGLCESCFDEISGGPHEHEDFA